MGKDRVCYFYDDDVAGMYYGSKHPMQPQRITMTHHLVLGYELHNHMDVYTPKRLHQEDFRTFHSKAFVNFLANAEARQRLKPTFHGRAGESAADEEAAWHEELYKQQRSFGINADCPVFPGLFDFCRIYAGASVDGARKLNMGQYDVAINWSGGLHHGKKGSASGFCYVNDLVLAILELLKVHARVLYIDIDVHHGDGVEEAFYTSDRVMTCSFHKGFGFFPGSGFEHDIGEGPGRGYSVNLPMHDGVTNELFHSAFKPVVDRIMEVYNPGAIVLQCGADSLSNDRLGSWALTIRGHCEAVTHTAAFKRPMLVTGGGGYTKANVARCWTNETAALLKQDIPTKLPHTVFDEYFADDRTLALDVREVSEKAHQETKADHVERVKLNALRNLDALRGAPAVCMKELPDKAAIMKWMDIHERSVMDDPAALIRLKQVIQDHKYGVQDDDVPDKY